METEMLHELHSVAQRGDFNKTRQLLEQGLAPNLQDSGGWTAQDRAACHGHLQVARLFSQHGVNREFPLGARQGPTYRISTEPRDSLSTSMPILKSTDPAIILVTLGPASTRSQGKAIELNATPSRPRSPTAGTTHFVKMTALHANGPEMTTKLPVSEDNYNQPLILRAVDPNKIELKFDLFEKRSGREEESLLGVGIASLRTLRGGYSTGREGLVRDHTISILTTDMREVAATVTFSLFIIYPYRGQKKPKEIATVEHGFWTSTGRTRVVGHRGSGANTTAHTNLQLGENTVSSLTSASALGATAVEFDVQLTKDLVPVIYHNFLVMETGGEATIWNLTRSQFVKLSTSQQSEPINDRSELRYQAKSGDKARKRRAYSIDAYDDRTTTDLVGRMQDTFAAKHHGIKGNLRGFAISDPFPTFKELLTKVPESVPFDLEMKYTMLWEAEDQEFEPYAVKANLFVDIVLDLVYEYGGKRNITFSSFSPEMCLLLKAKQQTYPILFISKAGSVPTGDIRASSVQQAVTFAKRWDLAGLVLLSDPLIMCPRLISYVKSAGLVCASYGDLNDDPANAKLQADHGLDAIIVNKVRLISQTLAK